MSGREVSGRRRGWQPAAVPAAANPPVTLASQRQYSQPCQSIQSACPSRQPPCQLVQPNCQSITSASLSVNPVVLSAGSQITQQ